MDPRVPADVPIGRRALERILDNSALRDQHQHAAHAEQHKRPVLGSATHCWCGADLGHDHDTDDQPATSGTTNTSPARRTTTGSCGNPAG